MSNDNVTPFPSRKDRQRRRQNTPPPQKPPAEPVINLPPLTKTILGLLLAVHIGRLVFLSPFQDLNFVLRFGFVPARFSDPALLIQWDTWASLFTHMFIHGSWLHLGLNILMLMAFGTAMEKVLGKKNYLLYLLACGLCGAAFHLLFFWGTLSPMIGASGALSGLFGGILLYFSERGHMAPGWRGLAPVILIWVGISLLFAFIGPGEQIGAQSGGSIAWTAHLGGFFGGLALFRVLRRLN